MSTHARPAWTLTVDGADITASIADRLVSLTLTDNRGFEADQLDIVLDDSDGKLDLPPRGAQINLALGWSSDGLSKLVDKGSYTVDEVHHRGTPDQLIIGARSADLRGGLTTQRERSFHGKTIGDIVRTIAGENDLKHVISKALDDQTVEHVDQTNESSTNLLTRLARMFDAIAAVKADRLLFVHTGRGTSASGTPFPPVLIERTDGDSHDFGIADRETYTAVRANYYDTGRAEKGEVIWGMPEEDAENGRRTPVASPTPEPNATQYKSVGARPAKSRAAAERYAIKEWKRLSKDKNFLAHYTGVEVAYDDLNLKAKGKVAYGRAEEQKARNKASIRATKDAAADIARHSTSAPQVGFDHSADNIKTIRHVYANKENAKRAARAEWRRLQRGMATFSINLATGRPEIIPETPATVRGWKPAIDSTDWIVARVTHNVTDAGYTTAVELEIKATEIPG